MALEDVLKGLQVFEQGMQKMAISNATRDANSRLNEINTQLADDTEKQIAVTKLGQELALRLTAAGANPGQIETIAQRLGPSPGQFEQQRFAAEQQKSSQAFQAGQSSLDRKNQRENTLLSIYGKNAADAQTSSALGKFGGVQLKPGAVYNEEDAKLVKKSLAPAKGVLTNVTQMQDLLENTFTGGAPLAGKERMKLKTLATYIKSELRGDSVMSQTMGAALSDNEEKMLDDMIQDPTGFGNRLQMDGTQRESYKLLIDQMKQKVLNKLDSYNYELEPGSKFESQIRASTVDPRLRKAAGALQKHNDPAINELLNRLQSAEVKPEDKNKIKSVLQRQGFSADLLKDF